MVLDDVEEVIDEPNFNNFNTSPDPPSPYADLEKKYRRNKFNRPRKNSSTDPYGMNGVAPIGGTKSSGNKSPKRKNKKNPGNKPATRVPNGKKS